MQSGCIQSLPGQPTPESEQGGSPKGPVLSLLNASLEPVEVVVLQLSLPGHQAESLWLFQKQKFYKLTLLLAEKIWKSLVIIFYFGICHCPFFAFSLFNKKMV